MDENLKYYINNSINSEQKDTLEVSINLHDSLRLFGKASQHIIKMEGYFDNYILNKEKEFSIIIINDKGEFISYNNSDL